MGETGTARTKMGAEWTLKENWLKGDPLKQRRVRPDEVSCL